MAAIRYLVNRLLNHPLSETNKKEEYDTIKQILLKNKYDVKILDKMISTNDAKTQERTEGEKTKIKPETKWATFTYVGRQTKF